MRWLTLREVRFIPMVSQDLVSQHAMAAQREPRMQTSYRLLHVQVGV